MLLFFFFFLFTYIPPLITFLMVKKPVTTALAINSVSCAIWKERADDHTGTQAPKLVCAN